MALRVLLADENVTIKKVIQLSLQDYAVNVKSVNLGVDVLDVAREFQPDVVFADILLQKRNGYEVCTDFKQDAELSKVPFVLMWSSFMELDQERYKICGADGEIEKPFDKDALRSIVQRTVAKLSGNALPDFIEGPPVPAMEVQPPPPGTERPAPLQPATPAPPASSATPPPPPTAPEQSQDNWNMDSFADIEEFVQKPLSQVSDDTPAAVPPAPPAPPAPDETDDWSQAPTAQLTPEPRQATEPSTPSNDQWAQADLNKFKLDLEEEQTPPSPAQEFSIDLSAADVAPPPPVQEPDEGTEDIPRLTPLDPSAAADSTEPGATNPQAAPTTPTAPAMAEAELERIIRAQSAEVIESIAWKVMPDLAEKIIREKIDQLMKEAEL